MFRKILYISIITAGLTACNESDTVATKTDSLVQTGINDLILQTSFNTEKLTGVYTGSFDDSPISLSINYVSGKNVSGYNVHKGLKRNMKGTIEAFGTRFKLLLDEPGDNQYDGHFELFVDTTSFSGKGTWEPKNDKAASKKTFSFTKDKAENEGLVNIWVDSLGRYLELKQDGGAKFSYYRGKGTAQEQLDEFTGNWQQKKDSVVLFWQKNVVFPSRRSAFFIRREKYDTAYFITSLSADSVEWSMAMP